MAADRTPIKCWGSRVRVLKAAGYSFKWKFLLAAVAFPILGADFLEHFDLLVDLRRRRLFRPGRHHVPLAAPPQGCNAAPIGVVAADEAHVASPSSSPSLASTPSPSPSPSCSPTTTSRGSGTGLREGEVADAAGVGEDVAAEFPEVLSKSKRLPAVKHAVEHVIETTCARPISARYRRLDPLRLKLAKQEFSEMENQGIIRRSKSAWSSPLHMVPKADGTWRPCGDYRRLNLVTKPDMYPPPHMEDLSAKLSGMTVFSKLDLRKGYYQVPVAEEDVQKTAIITPFGLYEFLRMPFGLRNAGQSFQRFMDQIMEGIQNIFVYMDDILVASESQEEHREHLRAVLQRLEEHGLVLNKEKCVFGASSVDYLGHVVSAEGIQPLQARVAAIQDFPPPTTRGELQRFLGMINYYRRFIRGAAGILKPLTDATRGPGGQSTPLTMVADMHEAFISAKSALVGAALLTHPRAESEVSLAVDASDRHVGGVLQQWEEGAWRPLAFYSRKLTGAETRYSTFDRELVAIVAAIRHFRFLLEGRSFAVWTDHKPLTYSLHQIQDAWSARRQRQLAYVAEYTSDIRHVPGVQNVVADSLSRPPAVAGQPPAVAAVAPPASTGPLSWRELADGQSTWAEMEELKKSAVLQLEVVNAQGVAVWCDMSTGVVRPLVAPGQRQHVFNSVHQLAHAGTRATSRMLSSRFVWPHMATDIKELCRQCVACQRGKVVRHVKTEEEKIAIPKQRFSHVHVDIVGPWPTTKEGYRYLLTIIDRSTRWFEVAPLQSVTSELVLDAFVTTWVARYGVPAKITTDRGAQFTAGLWTTWCQQQNVRHITTTAFHPQANGMIERFHRQLKDALRARETGDAWYPHLPWVLLGLRAAPKDECGVSTAEATLGQRLVVPGELHQPEESVQPPLRAECPPKVIPESKRTYAQVVADNPALDTVTMVYVLRGGHTTPLSTCYSGPFEVVARGPKVFQLKIGEKVETVSRDRLKPHLGKDCPQAEVPRGRGRPLGT